MTDLSTIVVSWNTRDLTLACLDALDAALAACAPELRGEVIAVDNGSRDGSAEALARRRGVRLVRLPGNVGFAAGANAGLAEARGRHVLLLNSDARIGADALRRCVAYLDENPDVGIAGPRLLHPDGRVQNSVHAFPGPATELVPRALLQWLLRERYPSRRWLGDAPRDVEAVRGAALFARAEMVRRIGPLPEAYFFFLEETAWCWRARRAGWRVVFLPDAWVVHESGASSKRPHPSRTRIEYHRSLYRFHRDHRGTGSMAMALSLRLLRSLVETLALAPAAGSRGRAGARFRERRALLAWHLRGCPARDGLAGLAPTGGPTP